MKKILLAVTVFVLSILFLNGRVSAEEVKNLEPIPVTTSASVTNDTSFFKENISLNPVTKKEEVKRLQGFLINQELLHINGAPTGVYGPKTKAAVRELQEKLDITPTGTVGPITRGKLNKIITTTKTLDTTDPTEKETTPVSPTIPPVAGGTTGGTSGEITPPPSLPVVTPSPVVQPEKIIVRPTEKIDVVMPNPYLPRVMFWQGKVNQHVDLATGAWATDPDGLQRFAGAEVDHLEYCKMFYKNTTSIVPYMYETIDTWHNRGNLLNFTSTLMSYRCVQPGETVTGRGSVLGASTSTTVQAKTPSYVGTSFSKYLIARSTGDEVMKLQQVLKDNGYLDSTATSFLGTQTTQAIKDFQEDNGLAMTGTVGPQTRAALTELARMAGPCANGQPLVKVKKPNGGQSYVLSDVIKFKWRACNQGPAGKFGVALIQQTTGYNLYLVSNLAFQSRTYNWTVPSTVMAGQYKARVFCSLPNSDAYCIDRAGSEDEGDNSFTITVPVVAPASVTTLPATNITESQAQLGGSFFNNDPVPGDVKFEYGLTSALGMTSQHMAMSGQSLSSSSVGIPISGLTPSTTYYYRLVVQNTAGIGYGSILTFTTSSLNANIDMNLSNMRAEGEVFHDSHNFSYLPTGGIAVTPATLCSSTTTGPLSVTTNMLGNDSLMKNWLVQAYGWGGGSAYCYNTTSVWAVAVDRTIPGTSRCVDSAGYFVLHNGLASTAIDAAGHCI